MKTGNRSLSIDTTFTDVHEPSHRKHMRYWLLGYRQVKSGITAVKKPRFCYTGFRHLRNHKE